MLIHNPPSHQQVDPIEGVGSAPAFVLGSHSWINNHLIQAIDGDSANEIFDVL